MRRALPIAFRTTPVRIAGLALLGVLPGGCGPSFRVPSTEFDGVDSSVRWIMRSAKTPVLRPFPVQLKRQEGLLSSDETLEIEADESCLRIVSQRPPSLDEEIRGAVSRRTLLVNIQTGDPVGEQYPPFRPIGRTADKPPSSTTEIALDERWLVRWQDVEFPFEILLVDRNTPGPPRRLIRTKHRNAITHALKLPDSQLFVLAITERASFDRSEYVVCIELPKTSDPVATLSSGVAESSAR